MTPQKSIIFGASIMVILTVASCSDWQTTPVTVDKYRGLATTTMIEKQTMYPEHAYEERQVMELDGPKGEGIMKSYRQPATDLRKGKQGYYLNLQGSSGGMRTQ